MRRILIVILILLTSSIVIVSQTTTPTSLAPTTTDAPPATADPVAEARELVDEARDIQSENLDMVNTLLGAIQAASILIAALAALAAVIASYIGLRSIPQLRQQLDDAKQESEALRALKADTEKMQEQLQDQLDAVKNLPDVIEAAQAEQQKAISGQLLGLSFTQFALRQIDVGNREAALRTLQRARDADPNNPIIRFFLGEIHVRLNQLDEGIDYLKDFRDDDTLPDAQATLAYAYRLKGDDAEDNGNDDAKRKYHSDALSLYNTLWQEHRELLDISGESVYGALGGLYRRQGQIEEAFKTYTEVAKITPASSYPINNLGLLHFEYSGKKDFADIEEGRKCFEKARRKAKYALQAESADYWRLFDLITSEIALEEIGWEDLERIINEMLDYEPIPGDLDKLVDGLERLSTSAHPPRWVDRAISYLRPGRDTDEQT